MDIREFLNARFDDLEVLHERDDTTLVTLFKTLDAQREIIKWHANWPILVEKKPELSVADDFDINSMIYKMSAEIRWMTEAEYVRKFGSAPPTTPILRIMAQPFSYHEDFDPDWLIK